MLRKSKGFTLLEVTLALAIAGGLVVIAFAGQKQARDRSSFNDAVERADTIILDAKNQAFSTVQNANNGACSMLGQYCNTFLGKAVYFQGGMGSVVVYTVTLDPSNIVHVSTDSTTVLPYGVIDTDHSPNQDVCILFSKSPETAQTAASTKVHCDPLQPSSNPHSIADIASFIQGPAGAITVDLAYNASLTAQLKFDPSNMNITKVFP